MKERLDVLLVKRNLASSREKAKAIIMSGNVFVDGQREDKAGTTFAEDVSIEVKGSRLLCETYVRSQYNNRFYVAQMEMKNEHKKTENKQINVKKSNKMEMQ